MIILLSDMTKILISVTSVDEAELALDHGADIIDLKDPSQGALGALPLDTISKIVAFVHEKNSTHGIPVSATIGDLPMDPELLASRILALSKTDVDIIKIGFFQQVGDQAVDYQQCLKSLIPLINTGIKLVAVLFVEFEYPQYLISAIGSAGFIGVMFDTALKTGATYQDYYSLHQMKKIAAHAHANDLLFGLAGSLNLQHVACVKEIAADYIGFRGGVCDNFMRQSSLDADKIIAIRNAI